MLNIKKFLNYWDLLEVYWKGKSLYVCLNKFNIFKFIKKASKIDLRLKLPLYK
jgi:hypothetical protein